MFEKKEKVELNCKCGHDVMMHGHYNMACSVLLEDAAGQHKCPCSKFERA